MVDSENSSDNTIRIGVENVSDGDINIEVVDKVTHNNGEDILIGVDNHSISGNNNIKVHDIDFRGIGNARVGAGNYAHGSNNIFIGSLQPTTNGSSSNSEDAPSPPRSPNRPCGLGGSLLSPLLSRRATSPRVPSGPLLSVRSDDADGSSLQGRSQDERQRTDNNNRRSSNSQFVTGPSTDWQLPNAARTTPLPPSRSNSIRRGPILPNAARTTPLPPSRSNSIRRGPILPNAARTTPLPLSRSNSIRRGPIRPQPPNGPQPPYPPIQPFST